MFTTVQKVYVGICVHRSSYFTRSENWMSGIGIGIRTISSWMEVPAVDWFGYFISMIFFGVLPLLCVCVLLRCALYSIMYSYVFGCARGGGTVVTEPVCCVDL